MEDPIISAHQQGMDDARDGLPCNPSSLEEYCQQAYREGYAETILLIAYNKGVEDKQNKQPSQAEMYSADSLPKSGRSVGGLSAASEREAYLYGYNEFAS
jgi:hypothetical protein